MVTSKNVQKVTPVLTIVHKNTAAYISFTIVAICNWQDQIDICSTQFSNYNNTSLHPHALNLQLWLCMPSTVITYLHTIKTDIYVYAICVHTANAYWNSCRAVMYTNQQRNSSSVNILFSILRCCYDIGCGLDNFKMYRQTFEKTGLNK